MYQACSTDGRGPDAKRRESAENRDTPRTRAIRCASHSRSEAIRRKLPIIYWWRGLDSNQRTLARADLQSAAFNHSATSPRGLPRAAGPVDLRAWRGRRATWRRGDAVSTRSTNTRAGRRVARAASFARSKNQAAPGSSIFGAGEGNRTLVVSLEGFCSTIELHPLGPGCVPCHSPVRRVNRCGLGTTLLIRN
jgi:hypothetical protein